MERIDLFPTPLHLVEYPDAAVAAPRLLRYLEVRRATEPTLTGAHSNRGGWHSPPDLQHVDDGALRGLCTWVLAQFMQAIGDVAERDVKTLPVEWGISAWAMVLDHGAYSAPHDHADAAWSGVYWVSVGAPSDGFGGRLGFLDPRTGIARRHPVPMFAPDFSMRPRAGTLALFPSWLRHQVQPLEAKGPRVSISFNLHARAS